jgi:hypothetical protein
MTRHSETGTPAQGFLDDNERQHRPWFATIRIKIVLVLARALLLPAIEPCFLTRRHRAGSDPWYSSLDNEYCFVVDKVPFTTVA